MEDADELRQKCAQEARLKGAETYKSRRLASMARQMEYFFTVGIVYYIVYDIVYDTFYTISYTILHLCIQYHISCTILYTPFSRSRVPASIEKSLKLVVCNIVYNM